MARTTRFLYESNMYSEPVIPTYALYGESAPQDGGLPDALHWESVSARSRAHGWRIDAHRHTALSQFFWLERGGARARLDGRELFLKAGGALFVPALCVHAFDFEPEAEGHVLTVARDDALEAGLSRPVALAPGTAAAAELSALFGLLSREYARPRRRRGEALRRYAWLVALWFAREAAAEAPRTGRDPASAALARRYLALIEARYSEQPSVTDCARSLGVSPTHLGRACREAAGKPAKALLHARLALEAKRRLAYTSMSVAEIAFSLGFSDPAYFSRFFARCAGRSPTAFRREAEGGAEARGEEAAAGGEATLRAAG